MWPRFSKYFTSSKSWSHLRTIDASFSGNPILGGACLNICAAELNPLVGARKSDATEQRTSQERLGNMARVKRPCKKARLRREPRAPVPHWATKAVCFSSSVTAIIAKMLQPCHRGRKLLHLPCGSWHTYQNDGNDFHSNGQDVPRIGDPDWDLIVLAVSLFVQKRTRRVSGLPCLVSSCLSISELLKFKLFAGFHVRMCYFILLCRLLKVFINAERPLYCCCWWAANRRCCRPGVEPGESSAPVA